MLEVQDQAVGRLDFSQSFSPWLEDVYLLSVSSHGLSSVCTWRKKEIEIDGSSSSYKDTSSVTLVSFPHDVV